VPNILYYVGKYMGGGYMPTGTTNLVALEIGAAWYEGAKTAYLYHPVNVTDTAIKFAIAGDNACWHDKLTSTNTPSGSWVYDSRTVWQP
jgi:hypothetical protein